MCIDMQGAAAKVDSQCRTSMKNLWAIGRALAAKRPWKRPWRDWERPYMAEAQEQS